MRDKTASSTPKYMLFHVHGTEEHTQNALWPGLCSKYSAPNVEVWGRRGARKEKSLWAKDQVLNLCGSLGFRGQATMRERELGWEQRHIPPPWPYLKKKRNHFKLKSGGKGTYLQPNKCSTLTFSFWKSGCLPELSALPHFLPTPPTVPSTKGFPQLRHSASFLRMWKVPLFTEDFLFPLLSFSLPFIYLSGHSV